MRTDRLSSESGLTLVELLVVISIASILSTMLIGSWITLSRAFARNSISAQQVEIARDGMSRMARELRDLQQPLPGQGWPISYKAVRTATPTRIDFFTTFNQADNREPLSRPVYIRYSLQKESTGSSVASNRYVLMRYESYDDIIFGETDDEMTVVTYVVNSNKSKPVFQYYYTEADGTVKETEWATIQLTSTQLATLFAIRVNLLVDLNPGASPEHVELTTTVQPRNLRDT